MTPRLYTHDPLTAAARLTLGGEQGHYLMNVLRCVAGDDVLLFNGRDGEWRGTIDVAGRKAAELVLTEQTRTQPEPPPADLWLLFAPLKRGPTDLLIQKATELGAASLKPVITERTQTRTVRDDRLDKIALEAAEQCERLDLPQIAAPRSLVDVLADWPEDRALILCAEAGPARPIADVAQEVGGRTLAVLTGPEGGFSPDELTRLSALPHVSSVSLGPRILKAETAAIAALAITQALAGDFDVDRPRFPRP